MGTWLGRTKSAESSAPHLAKSLRGNEIYTHILLHSLSHALSHAPFLSHRSSFSHFQTFNPSLLDSTLWVYKKQKNPSLFCCYCTFEVFSCNDPQSRNRLYRPGSRIVKSKAGQVYFATELIIVLYSDLHPCARLHCVSWHLFWSLFLLYCSLLADLGLDTHICCRVGTPASLLPFFEEQC